MDLKEIGIDVMNWIELGKDRDHWKALVRTGRLFVKYNIRNALARCLFDRRKETGALTPRWDVIQFVGMT